jgi:2-polyprenyl-6-methoxyphenol hydroxylase-like FAD-dependent oxidoreductase
LGGNPLLTNKSIWTSFRTLRTERWSHGNVVLIGDALRTVHFSIGSGTRTALEDAIALSDAIAGSRDVEMGLKTFEINRRPAVEKVLKTAERSFAWYERLREKLRMAPIPFAYDYLMRGGSISTERLRERSPKFAAAHQHFVRQANSH